MKLIRSHHRLASAAVAMFAVLLPSQSTCLAQGEVSTGWYSYDRIDLAAIALALEIPGLRDGIEPQPSDGLAKIVRLRPKMLLTLDDGIGWSMQLKGQRKPSVINLERYPLKPDDVAAMEAILESSYVAKWVACMSAAWEGRATEQCIRGLLDEAAKRIHERGREEMLADLGARMVALAPQNNEWSEMLYQKEIPGEVRLALEAFEMFETAKLQAALAYLSDRPNEAPFTFANAAVRIDDRVDVFWNDFAGPGEDGDGAVKGPSRRPFTTWKVDDSGEVVAIRDNDRWEEGNVFSLWLSEDRQAIIVGELLDKAIREIRETRGVEDLVRVSEKWDFHVFLSRSGSSNIGVVKGSE